MPAILAALLVVSALDPVEQGCADALLRDQVESPMVARFRSELAILYGPEAREQLWIRGSGPTAQARTLARILSDTASEGLRPQDYEAPLWEARFGAPLPSDRCALIALDLAFSAAVMRYASDFALGRVDPRLIGIDVGSGRRGIDLAAVVRTLAEVLPEGARVGDRYDGELVLAVQRFQRRHGLEPDGRIGRDTLRALATPLSRRVTQLELTLERLRWLPRDIAGTPIVVNVPAFRLLANGEEGRPALSMKVVVGRAFRHETPLFVSSLREVIFQPYWYVPRAILREEILPELRKDATLFEKRGYEIVDARGGIASGTAPDAATAHRVRQHGSQ